MNLNWKNTHDKPLYSHPPFPKRWPISAIFFLERCIPSLYRIRTAHHTTFVVPIVPLSPPHIVPPSLCSLLSTFYHSNTSNISQLSHISRFSHISQKIHPSHPSQMFPTHNSHPTHLLPRLYIAGRRHSLSLNSQNSQNSYWKKFWPKRTPVRLRTTLQSPLCCDSRRSPLHPNRPFYSLYKFLIEIG